VPKINEFAFDTANFDEIVKTYFMPLCSTWNQNNLKQSIFSYD